MRSPRWVVLLGALLGGAASAQTRQDVVVWGVNIGPDQKGEAAVVRVFEQRNPDLRIRLTNMGAGGMNPQKLLTSIVGNVAPDVVAQDRFTISDWAAKNAFRPLDDLVERDKADPLAPHKEDYYPAPWSEATYQGHLYGIPTSSDDRILYYNRGIFKKRAADLRAAGLDPDRPPRTWSEILAYSKVLTEKNRDGTLKVAGYMPNYGNTWLYLYAFQNNASFMSADGRTCTLDSPAAEEALQFMVDGYKIIGGYENAKSFESGFLGKENDPFLTGKVAMKTDGDWILADLSRYGTNVDIGVGPAPVPDDRFNHTGRFAHEKETFITWMGGFALGIPRGARNVEGAWRYIKFYTSYEGRMIQMRAQRDADRLRGRQYIPRQIAQMKANQAASVEFRPADKKFADAVDMHTKMAPFGKIRPPTFVGQLLWNEHVRAIETACLGNATPKDALLTSQRTVQRELDAYFEKDKYPVINLDLVKNVGITLMLGIVVGYAVWVLRQKQGRLARHETLWAYLFLAPWILGFLVFTAGPMLASLFFSFTQYDVLNEARYIGVKNFHDLANSDWPLVSKAFGNALYLAIVGVPLGSMTGLAVAMLLNASVRGMRYYRTMFYMPAIVPGVASAILWTWVLSSDSNKGLINAFLKQTIGQWLGVSPPGWLQSADWAKPALILMGVWGAGSGMILWLAGLKGISATLYEAASIDGASPKAQFFRITLPQLSPIIFFNLVMGFIGSLQEFERIYVMKPASDGSVGPDDSMLTPVFHLFRNGFEYFKMGYASALAWAIFLLILVLTGTQWWLSKKWVHYEVQK